MLSFDLRPLINYSMMKTPYNRNSFATTLSPYQDTTFVNDLLERTESFDSEQVRPTENILSNEVSCIIKNSDCYLYCISFLKIKALCQ